MSKWERTLLVVLIIVIGVFGGFILYDSVLTLKNEFATLHAWMFLFIGLSMVSSLFTIIYSVITLSKFRHFSNQQFELNENIFMLLLAVLQIGDQSNVIARGEGSSFTLFIIVLWSSLFILSLKRILKIKKDGLLK